MKFWQILLILVILAQAGVMLLQGEQEGKLGTGCSQAEGSRRR